jgi:hypothetical protein
MRTSVTLGYLLHGVPIRPNREICILDIHPGFLDGISLTDLISLATSTYETVEGNFEKAAAAILPVLKDLYAGKNVIGSTTDHLTYLQHGRFIVNGQPVHPDEIRVVFRATSEDTLTKSIGQVAQSADIHGTQIRDDGEMKQEHQYTRRFSIPLMTIAPGDYVFTFGSGDDGWFFDVGANTILTVTILPRPA